MTITDNKDLAGRMERYLADKLPVRLGVNKMNELARLLYEICRAEGVSPENVADRIGLGKLVENGRSRLFHSVKHALVSIRYPSAVSDKDLHIMPLKIRDGSAECPARDHGLRPKRIFVENSVKDLKWTRDFLEHFPDAAVMPVAKASEGFKLIGKNDYNKRHENVFIVKSKTAFIKICPCTKGYKRCGYWILNIGFGCPIDCSYCYLQMYSNVPGMVLPANIEDYYEPLARFDKKCGEKTRIGTGEFTDSLAFDKYAKYSSKLIPFFRGMEKLVLELKTKVSDIDVLLKEEPHPNVVISWSLNPPGIAGKYEKGAPPVDERIEAASRAALRGYRVGFHFDPLIYYGGWEKDYRSVVEKMFSSKEIRERAAWISLGTLRYTPGLKQAAENRFADNLIFYKGEFFMDTDGKMRYSRNMRAGMYKKMVQWIRESNKRCWVYLCMEPESMWREAGCKPYGG